MKKIIFLLLLSVSSVLLAQNAVADTLSINILNGRLTVSSTALENINPQFTPGNHGPDTSITLINSGRGIYAGELLKFKRGFGSGIIGNGNVIIYHLSSGFVPANLYRPIVVRIDIPSGKDLVYHGQVWQEGVTEVEFPDFFAAREFPIILVEEDKYLVRSSRLNRVDSMLVVYCWVDSLTHSKLREAFAAVDSAALRIGELAPSFWHKFINNYGSVPYVFTYIINNEVITGLEHFNAPYSVTVPFYIRMDGAYHTLLHSLIGKALMPKEYLAADGKYHQSDVMFLYEGLVTFLSMKHADNFPASLAGLIYKAELFPAYDSLKNIGLDHQFESYYAKGYLNWLDWQNKGLNVELMIKYWLSIKLILSEKVPVAVDYETVIKWVADYDKMLGHSSPYLLPSNLNGGYVESAFKTFEDKGLQIIPMNQVARWDTAYIGPYPINGISPKQPMLPVDNYPILETGVRPAYLILSGGQRIPIGPEKDNPALKILRQFPDSLFPVVFSDSSVIKLTKNLYFSRGKGNIRYFMHSNLDDSSYYKNKDYWDSINVNLRKEKAK